MRNPGQPLPDHAAILATLSRSMPADPATVPPGAVVRVTGTAQPGPGGVLTAPLSGRPCVWFRVLEVRHAKFGPVSWSGGYAPAPVLHRIVASDMGFAGPVSVDDESRAPFTVVGEHGPVLVDPVRADVSTPVVSVDSTEGQWRFTEYVLRREWLVEPGAPVFALGAVADGPVLRATPADCTVVSAYGEAVMVQRARSSLAVAPNPGSAGRLALVLSVGVVVLIALLVVLALVLVG